jgi:hypothetical protein
VRAYFVHRSCATLPRPVDDEDALQGLGALAPSSRSLRREFREALAALRSALLDGARAKEINGRALSGAECKRWLRDAPVDLSVFGAVQPIYTAAPLFIGMIDPLPRRLVTLDGAARVVPPSAEALAPPARRTPRAPDQMVQNGPGSGHYAARALARAYGAVATAPINTRHRTAVSEGWGLARLVARGLLSAEDVARALDGALQDAGKPAGEGAKIAAWAVAHRMRGAA